MELIDADRKRFSSAQRESARIASFYRCRGLRQTFSAACSLMIDVKPLFQCKYPGGARRSVMWMRMVGDGTETTVEQALIRGLDTA